jgi:plastocyanin
MMRRWMRFWSACVVVIFAGALYACTSGGGAVTSSLPQARSAVPLKTAASPVHWHIAVGASRRDGALEALDFFTSTITIDAGDSVTWTWTSEHTVSFLLPDQSPFTAPLGPAGGDTEDGSAFTSSGDQVAPFSYTLTFPKPGSFTYFCLLHPPEMTGQVIVNPAGTRYPHPQGYYTGQGNAEANSQLAAAQGSVRLFPYADGGPTLVAGISPGLAAGAPSNATVYRFLGADNLVATTTTVTVGTTVTWVDQTNNEPHTVTFPIAGQPLPPAILNNPFSPPMGGATYDGSAIANSGPIGSATGFPANSYSLTFTKPGTYIYYCLFHHEFGMIGTIVVVAR